MRPNFAYSYQSDLESLVVAVGYFNALASDYQPLHGGAWWADHIDIRENDGDEVIGTLHWHGDGYYVIEPKLRGE